MSYSDAVRKLASLYVPDDQDLHYDVLTILHKLLRVGMIAGGSVVWAMGHTDVKPNDIDLFVTVKENKDCIVALKRVLDIMRPVFNYSLYRPTGSKYSDLGFEVVDVNPTLIGQSDRKISIQLIFTTSTHLDILSKFDFDYLRTGLHDNKVLFGDCPVTVNVAVHSLARCRKALVKGYPTSILVNSSHDPDNLSGQVTTLHQLECLYSLPTCHVGEMKRSYEDVGQVNGFEYDAERKALGGEIHYYFRKEIQIYFNVREDSKWDC
jgi:hypothetical protein